MSEQESNVIESLVHAFRRTGLRTDQNVELIHKEEKISIPKRCSDADLAAIICALSGADSTTSDQAKQIISSIKTAMQKDDKSTSNGFIDLARDFKDWVSIPDDDIKIPLSDRCKEIKARAAALVLVM